jgi:hypothetical protein
MSDYDYVPPNLDFMIDCAITDFEQEVEGAWDDPVQGAKINALASRTAELMLGAAESLLIEADHGAWRRLPDLLRSWELHEEVSQALQIRIARSYMPSTASMVERCFELTQLVVRASPREQVQRFLARVGRCYILGLVPETVIVCRAALENALNEKYFRMRHPWPQDASKASPMKLRIQTARSQDWLTDEAAAAAEVVWTRGSKAAHADPLVVQHALETVRYTMSVLEQLYAE